MADQNFRVKRGLEVGVGGTVLIATPLGNIGVGITNPLGTFQVGTAITMYGASGIISATRFDGSINAPGKTYYVAVNGSDSNTGNNLNEPYATLKHALSVATSGDTIFVQSGTFTEIFPLTVPVGVTIRGVGLRGTFIQPTEGTKQNDGFLLNGETTVEDLSIGNFYEPGYGFRFANNSKTTTRSPYIQRVTVLNRGSVTSSTDPYGFDTPHSPPSTYKAGRGALIDGSVVTTDTLEPAMLFNECTFIIPNNTALEMTNGARTEWVNCFSYLADKGIHAYDGTVGVASTGYVRIKTSGITTGGSGYPTTNDELYYLEANYRSGTYSQVGTALTITRVGHGLTVGDRVFADFTSGTATDGFYRVTGYVGVNTFSVTMAGSATTSGNVSYKEALGFGTVRSYTSATGLSSITGKGEGLFELPTSRLGKTVTAYGDAQLSTLQKKIGTASLYVDGTGDYARCEGGSDFTFSGNFTVEAWIYPTSVTGSRHLFALGTETTGRYHLSLEGGVVTGNFFGSASTTFGGSISTNTWTHIALVRSGSTITAYVNGTALGTTETNSSSIGNTGQLTIGADNSGTNAFVGYIDEVRISNTARYTATFTPSTTQFNSDGSDKLLLHLDGASASTSFIDSSIPAQDIRWVRSGVGIATATKITLADYQQFGAEMRSIGSAVVFGNTGVSADGPGVGLRLFAFNFGHIGSGKDFSQDVSLVNQAAEVVKTNNANVYFVSIDQGGDFRVGDAFYVNQEAGTVNFGGQNFTLNSLSDLNVTDGTNTNTLTPTYLTVGNIQISGNEITSTSGNININPSGTSETHVDGNLNVSGILTASVLQTSALQIGDTSIAIDDTGSNGTIRFNTDGAEALRINNIRNIGIGTTNPSEKLDVFGTIKTQQLNVTGVSTLTTANVTTGNIVTGVVTTLSGTTATYTTGNFGTANATTGNIVTGVVTTLSGSDVSYTTGNFGTANATTGNIATGVVTTLSGTNATYTTGNFTTANATTGNIVTGVVTTLSGTTATYTTGNLTTLNATTGNIVTGLVTTLSGTTATYTTGNFGTANATTGNIVTGVVTTISGTTATYTTGNLTTLNATTGNIVTGVITTLSGTNLNYTGISTLGVTTFTGNVTFGAIGISTLGTITGPSEITIDPAGVGDNTGAVRIKGDLYVDGTQTIINSATIELADFNVGIATTVGTDALLNGAGIGIGSTNIRKTINWNNSLSALSSSENWNIASGKTYKIGGTDVLSSTTLGSGVVNSSLTSVGTLGELNVSGVSTFQGNVNLGDNIEIRLGNAANGDLAIYHDGSNSYVVDRGTGDLSLVSNGTGVTLQKTGGEILAKFLTDGAAELYYDNSKKFETTGAGVTVFGTTETQQLSVSGVSTFTGNVSFGSSAYFGDNHTLYFGNANDLSIYSNGSASFIKEQGTGSLFIDTNNIVNIRKNAAELLASFNVDGSVELYYDNSKKFETTGYGATVFGILETQGLFSSGISTISVNSSFDALRITQTGAGNALVVEDSSNPDASPFVVGAAGSVGIGTTKPTAPLTIFSTDIPQLKLNVSADGIRSEDLRTNNANTFNITNKLNITPWPSNTYSLLELGAVDSNDSSTGGIRIHADGNVGGSNRTAIVLGAFYSGITELNAVTIRGTGLVGIGSADPTSKLDVGGNVKIVGVVTASSFVKSGGTSSQFLKADGSVDSSTYLTSYTETDTLNTVTGRGNVTSNGISVGLVTVTQLVIGTGVTLTSSGLRINSGIITASSFVKSGGTSSQFLKADGSVDSSTYSGQIEVRGEGTQIGTAATTFNFVGSGVTATYNAGITTITISGGGGSGAPGGSDTQVQFNDGGSTLGGDSGLTYNKTTDTLSVTGGVNVGTGVTILPSGIRINTGIVTAQSFVGDGSGLTGVGFALTVGTRTAGVNNNDAVSNVKAIRFAKTPFSVTDLGSGEVLIQSESTFNPWYVNGQGTLKATGEEPIEFIAGPGIAITTKEVASAGIGTTFSKAITFNSVPSGSDTQIQFNDGGSTFGGDSGLTYNKTTDILSVTGGVNVGTGVTILSSGLRINSGIVTASSFVKSDGTSSQFLKADGSVDSSTYLTSYTETDTLDSVTTRGRTTSNGISVGLVTVTQLVIGTGVTLTSSGLRINSGIITASSFVKPGATSSEFLKGDGSTDANTYLTTTGNGVNLTGIVTSIVAGTNVTISGSTGQVTINASGGSTGIGTTGGNGSNIRSLSGTHLVSYSSQSDFATSAQSISGVSTYTQIGILTASTYIGFQDNFGKSVATSADGKTVVVGAWQDEDPNASLSSGVVHVFDRVGNSFIRVGVLTGLYAVDADDKFGLNVATSADGKTIVVGTDADEYPGSGGGSGVVYVFDRVTSGSTTVFNPVGVLTGTNASNSLDKFGSSLSCSADGNTIVVGASNDKLPEYANNSTGLVYVFDRIGESYSQTQILSGPDDLSYGLGFAVNVTSDGKTIFAGTNDQNLVHFYDRVGAGNTFVGVGTFSGSVSTSLNLDYFGKVIVSSADGRTILAGTPNEEVGATTDTGLVYIFDRVGNTFNEVGILTGIYSSQASDLYGESLAISADGKTIVVGAQNDETGATTSTGVVYVYKRLGNTFNPVGILTGSSASTASDQFGTSVAISADGKSIIVGARQDEITASTNHGTVYVFDEVKETYLYSAQTGNIGIGTTNPTSKLHVSGGANIVGTVTATAFVGDGSGLTNLPGGGSSLTVQEEGSNVGTAATTLNFVGAGVTATYSGGTATITISGGGGTPGGSDTQIQFNDGGSTFGGDSGLTYNKTTDALSVTGGINVGTGVTISPNGLQINTGIITASSFKIPGGTQVQFLKADGSVDSSTYLTSYTETDTLDSVTTRGRTTSNGISVGIITAANQIKIQSSDSNPGRIDLFCEIGNAHYTRLQAAPHNQYGGNAVVVLPAINGDMVIGNTSVAIDENINTTGIITANSFVKPGATSSEFLKGDGSTDANTYLTTTGNGVNLTGIVTSIVAGTNVTISGSTGRVTINASGGGGSSLTVQEEGSNVGTAATTLNFVGAGVTATYSGGTATITISGGGGGGTPGGSDTQIQFNDGGSTFGGDSGLTYNKTTDTLSVAGGIIVTGVVTATDFNSSSDITLKNNVRTIEDPLAKVMSIRGVNFEWKESGQSSAGVLAQEIEKIMPELVRNSTDGIKSVNYNGLIGLLIEVVKEQQNQINELKSKLS